MLKKTACFDPDGDTFTPEGSDGFDSGYFSDGWDRAAGRAVVSLIVKLERLARSEAPPDERIEELKVVEPQVMELSDGMPKPVASTRHPPGKGAGGQTLEQRLYCLTAKNLKIALEAFDRSPLAYADGAAAERYWLVRRLFRLFSREIEYCVKWDRPWPPFLWQGLHDLYFYLFSRKDLDLDAGETEPHASFDVEQEYKRLLLLGLVKLLARPRDRSPMLFRELPAWAKMSELKEVGPFVGTFGLLVVDIFSDEPPRRYAGALEAGFNGWVLQPAQGFRDYVAGLSATV